MRRDALKAAALAALLATATAFAAHRSVKTTESETFADKTAGKKYDLPVPAGGGRVRLRMKGVVTAGEIRFRVLDSAGTEHQNARLTPDGPRPDRFDLETGEPRVAAGSWTLEVELKGATGRYEFTWTVD
ncbi:MAG: hypothetical protein M3444_19080 [Acidobacteriota bacterium]|nr:hypothetical protein [Acidobacteriota bacterium]MDQ5835490.1 hypothetical protein [Acidobacteriota bacterium]